MDTRLPDIPQARRVTRLACARGAVRRGERTIPEETPVALVHNGSTYAVMMATPADFEDFGVGFSLTEGVIGSPDDVKALEVLEFDSGIEIRMWLDEARAGAMVARRRQIAGPTGCGLCGVESLDLAVKPARLVGEGRVFATADIEHAIAALRPAQALNHETRAVHAAAFWRPEGGLLAVREDVGRHNALDKLVGHLARRGEDAAQGLVLLTSRVSIEMVQKAAVAGASVIVAVSAPTALAVRTAEAAGLTLVAIARDDGFEVFTHPHRIATGTGRQESVSDVA
ncbi:formate dehydrogenase accessory sulfurtransferase FdhD [Ancylobacter terrae]|uniref:formate dehydrogenase accessory sulfurtransferase FdhD n=1 Tax=Ancylobacter sp. sgz301288 TaxID=3342077 RepID=UPI00385C744E